MRSVSLDITMQDAKILNGGFRPRNHLHDEAEGGGSASNFRLLARRAAVNWTPTPKGRNKPSEADSPGAKRAHDQASGKKDTRQANKRVKITQEDVQCTTPEWQPSAYPDSSTEADLPALCHSTEKECVALKEHLQSLEAHSSIVEHDVNSPIVNIDAHNATSEAPEDHAETSHPKTQTREEILDARDANLKAREERLQAQQVGVETRHQELKAYQEHLEAREEKVKTLETQSETRKVELDAREVNVEAREDNVDIAVANVKVDQGRLDARESGLYTRENRVDARENEAKNLQTKAETLLRQLDPRESQVHTRESNIDALEKKCARKVNICKQEDLHDRIKMRIREANLKRQEEDLERLQKKLNTRKWQADNRQRNLDARAEDASAWEQALLTKERWLQGWEKYLNSSGYYWCPYTVWRRNNT